MNFHTYAYSEVFMDNQEPVIAPAVPNRGAVPVKDVAPEPLVERRYTQINGATCDCCTVRLLKQLLGGRFGALTSLNTYLFQSFVSGQNTRLLQELNRIVLSSLKHTQLLGNAITIFCGLPRFSNGQGTLWSGRFVDYGVNSNLFLRENIVREERAIRQIQNALARITNESLRLLLNEIIQDKQAFIITFQSLLNG